MAVLYNTHQNEAHIIKEGRNRSAYITTAPDLFCALKTTYVSRYGNRSLVQCTRSIRLYRQTSF